MIKKYIEGFITTTGRGTGFVSQGEDELRENDIRIEAGFLKTALPNDRVKVLLYPKILGAKQQTGEVVEILERIKKTFVGTIKENGVVKLNTGQLVELHLGYDSLGEGLEPIYFWFLEFLK